MSDYNFIIIIRTRKVQWGKAEAKSANCTKKKREGHRDARNGTFQKLRGRDQKEGKYMTGRTRRE